MIALALLALVHFACQVPTQPTTITTNAPTTVVVQDQGNNPVKDPSILVWWKVLHDADSMWHPMPSTNPQIPDGTFEAVIPIPVGDDTSHVAFMVNAQNYTPTTQIDTEVGYCGSAVFTFHVTQVPVTITTCSPAAWTSTISLIANEPSTPIVSAVTRTFTNSYKALNFSFSPGQSMLPLPTPNTPNITIKYSTNSGKAWSPLGGFNAPVLINSTPPPTNSYLFLFQFATNSKATQNSTNQYVATIIGVDPQNGDTCVEIVDTLNTQIKVQTPCDCPTGTFTYFDTASTCAGTPVYDTVSLKNILNDNTQCTLSFSLASTSVLNSPNVTISSGDLNGVVIQPNQNIPGSLIIEFNPQSVKTYDVEYDYTISLQAPGGTPTPCDSVLRIHFHGTVGTPSCVIDPKSSILVNDTLKQVINSDSASGIKELCIKNTGGCPVSITGANLVPNSGHPFQILTTLPVIVPAGGSGCIEVSFTPTDVDVWPPSGVRGPPGPIDTFRATLQIVSSAGCDTSVPIIGVLTLPNYNNPCLQQWGTNEFYGGIVLDDSGTFTQSTEPASPNGFSIYASFVDPGGATATLTSGNAGIGGSYVTFVKIDHIAKIPTPSICDLSSKNGYSVMCGTLPETPSIPVVQGDVILFEYVDPKTGKQDCGLIWISDFAQTSGTGPYSVCFQTCFPI